MIFSISFHNIENSNPTFMYSYHALYDNGHGNARMIEVWFGQLHCYIGKFCDVLKTLVFMQFRKKKKDC